jgi:lipopolysaccharide biosynthesis glycosyltransferase
MRTYDLLTSCDDNLAPLLLPQIVSMSESFGNYNVNLHLAHSRITPEHIEQIAEFAKSNGINFIEHIITDNSKYDIIAEGGGEWPVEAYYSFDAHNYLDCERVLYFDAGDVVFDGDIARYYFEDFKNNLLIATTITYLSDGDEYLPFEQSSLRSAKQIKTVMRGIINSGCYVMNLSLMRDINLKLDDFIDIKEALKTMLGIDKDIYWGDQGLLGMACFGNIRFPANPFINNVYYMPYNFCIWYYDKFDYLWYEPYVIHFAAGKGKPWKPSFTTDELREILDNAENREPPAIKKYVQDFYEGYYRFAKLTPVYDLIKNKALENAQNNK